jgi:hypothetical protein
VKQSKAEIIEAQFLNNVKVLYCYERVVKQLKVKKKNKNTENIDVENRAYVEV